MAKRGSSAASQTYCRELSRKNGFTLIELITAISIFAVLSVMMYSFLGNMMTHKERQAAVSVQLESLQKALMILQQDFSQVINRSARDTFGEAEPPVKSLDEGGVIVTRTGWTQTPFANPSAPAVRSEIQRVQYRLEDEKLQRLYWLTPDIAPGVEPQVVTLLSDISDFNVRYLLAQPKGARSGGQLNWVDQWPPQGGSGPAITGPSGSPNRTPTLLPKAVEIKFTHKRYGELFRWFLLPQGMQ